MAKKKHTETFHFGTLFWVTARNLVDLCIHLLLFVVDSTSSGFQWNVVIDRWLLTTTMTFDTLMWFDWWHSFQRIDFRNQYQTILKILFFFVIVLGFFRKRTFRITKLLIASIVVDKTNAIELLQSAFTSLSQLSKELKEKHKNYWLFKLWKLNEWCENV